ncbi:MAG: FecR domain-containing protein [Gammaproteobacteria bacterium]|nr:FecR domain-containing protein [Gammaproteobacteria bacterium]
MMRKKSLWMLLACLVMTPMAYAAESAGTIENISGKAWAQLGNDKYQRIYKGAAIYDGTRVLTDKKAELTIRFADQSEFSLGNNTSIVIEKFNYTANADNNNFVTRITNGTFRFVSGLIAHKKSTAMTVKMGTVATIGVRGTDVTGEVTERVEKDGKVVEESARVVLMEPAEENKKTAIEVSNQFGSVVIDEPGYGTEIPDEHSAPTAVRKMQIRTINNVMRAVRSATPRAQPRMR